MAALNLHIRAWQHEIQKILLPYILIMMFIDEGFGLWMSTQESLQSRY